MRGLQQNAIWAQGGPASLGFAPKITWSRYYWSRAGYTAFRFLYGMR